MNSGTNIKVAVRVRPLVETDIKQGVSKQKIECVPEQGIIKVMLDEKQSKNFKFDHVFSESTSQNQFYDNCEIDSLLNQVLDGYHATIFAYGQTGSGKTYTMEGEFLRTKNESDSGIIPRTVRNLFSKVNRFSTSRQYSISCSYLQIYNERIYDLLGEKINTGQGQGLRLRWNPRDQFVVENLFVYSCKNANEVLELFSQGNKNRITAGHKLNLQKIKIESVDLSNPDNLLTSKLSLVDLAGSERINQSGAEGKQAKESIDINKSLFTLRQVINAVSEQITTKNPNIHAPYRDSKLTSLLKHCIGGNSYCLMIACIVPGDLYAEENISTLAYASKQQQATIITNIPQKNDDPKNKQIQELRHEIETLKEELNYANKHILFLTNLVQENKVIDGEKKLDNVKQAKKKSNEFERNLENKLESLKNHLEDRDQNEPLDYESFSDRLVDSINMVRELLLSNKELREKEERAQQKSEKFQRELLFMQKENNDLREKLQGLSNEDDKQIQEQNLRSNQFQKKRINSLIQSQRKSAQMNQDDVGFIPEQATQFQRQIMMNDIKNEHPDNNAKNQLHTQIKFNHSRNSSLPPKPNVMVIGPKSQLPALKYTFQNSAVQQFFDEEENNMNPDELTNFGRRTLFQNGNGYNQSFIKMRGDESRLKGNFHSENTQ